MRQAVRSNVFTDQNHRISPRLLPPTPIDTFPEKFVWQKLDRRTLYTRAHGSVPPFFGRRITLVGPK
jgi:hypothetical protein